MKKTGFLFFFLATTVLSCKKHAERSTITIEYQTDFENDHVQVFIDGHEEINKYITANHRQRICPEPFRTTKDRGKHTIKVIVNNSTQWAWVDLRRDYYLGINYDRQAGAVYFMHSEHPIVDD